MLIPVVLVFVIATSAQSLVDTDSGKPAYRTLRDVPYVVGTPSKYHLLDLYLPVSTTPSPLVVFIHGGGWYEGDKEHHHAKSLIERGYAVASINYRLTDEAIWPAQVHDTKAAIRYLRANASSYNIDPLRIGVWGMSAGGQLAALLGTSGDVPQVEGTLGPLGVSSRVQAVVDWFGPTDFVSIKHGQAVRKKAQWILTRLFGGPVLEHKELAVTASPVTFASADDPPFLIMHGDRDKLVPLEQSKRLSQLLQRSGAKSRLVVVKGKGHELFDKEQFDLVTQFFDETLKAPQARTALTY